MKVYSIKDALELYKEQLKCIDNNLKNSITQSDNEYGSLFFRIDSCDSPLEERFGEKLDFAINKNSSLMFQQVKIGFYRADFLLEDLNNKRRVIVEVDGKGYHNEDRDAYRDRYLLNKGDIKAVYRFEGSLVWSYPSLAVKMLQNLEPTYFDEKSKIRWNSIAHSEINTNGGKYEGAMFSFSKYKNIFAEISEIYLSQCQEYHEELDEIYLSNYDEDIPQKAKELWAEYSHIKSYNLKVLDDEVIKIIDSNSRQAIKQEQNKGNE